MGFDFKIEYKKGSENRVADALSRRDEVPEEGTLVAISSQIPQWVEAVREAQQSTTEVPEIIQKVQDGEAVGPWLMKDGLLFFKDRLYLTRDCTLVQEVVNQFHSSTHEGFHKTFQCIRANFYWPKM